MDKFVWCGIVGGLLSNLLRLIQWGPAPKPERVALFSDFGFYLQLLLLAGLGGGFVFLYQLDHVTFTPLLAVNVGATAPILARQLLANAPTFGNVG